MTRSPAGWAVAGALLLTACGGGDDQADPTTLPTTAPPSTTTTTALATTAPATIVAPTTVAVSTPAPTSAPPTPPPSTAAEPDLAAELQRDAQAGENELFAVLSDPNAADAEARLRRYYTGDALDSVLGTLAEFREKNFVVAANPDVPVTLLITGPATALDGADPPRASAQTCRLDSAWVMAPVEGSTARVPFNTTVYRVDAMSTFVLVDGIWQLEGGDLISESEGATSCA